MVVAQGFGGDVHVHPTRQRISDDERRRSEIIGAHLRVNPAFEVSVAGEDRACNEIAFLDAGGDRLRQRSAVADASRTAVTHEVKAELFQVGQKTALL